MLLRSVFPLIFTFIFLASALSQKSWADYQSKTEADIMAEVQEDIVALHNYPPFVCYALHKVEEKVATFVTKYESYYRKNRSFIFKIWNAIFFDKDKLNKNYYAAHFDLKNYFYEFRMLKKENTPSVNDLDNSELNLHDSQVKVDEHDSLLWSISDSKNKGKFDKFRIEDETFNYYLIGKMFATTLWNRQFMCYTVQELSLLIFRIFNHGFLDTKYIKRFFNGFYDGLYTATSNPAEDYLRGYLMEQFFTYNLQVMLNFDAVTAENLIKVFDHRQNKQELDDLITEFSTLYAYIIREVKIFWLSHNGSMESYLRQYHQNPKLFIENTGRGASVFLSIYAFRFLKGMILLPAHTFGAYVIEEQFKELSISLEKKIQDKLGPKYPDAIKQIQEVYLNRENAIPTKTFESFVETFEEYVAFIEKNEKCKFVDLVTLYETFQRSLNQAREQNKKVIL